MSDDTAKRLVELLGSIDTKLDALQRLEAQVDSIHAMLVSMKMDVSGFQHENEEFPGRLEAIEARLSDIQLILESIDVPKEVRPEDPSV
jgi:DNA repair ATPase RecN